MSGKKYNKEFKLAIAKLVFQEGKKISKVIKELGIIPSMLSRWIYQYETNGDNAFPVNGNLKKNSQ